MRILLVHNKYLHYGGEDTTFQNEMNILKNQHEVKFYIFDNIDIGRGRNKIQTFLDSIYNRNSFRIVEEIVLDFKPDIIHVHNFYYLASPSIFYLSKKHKIPIILTVQNYRLICSGAYLLRNDSLCELCVQKTFPIHGIVHRCNRNSYLQSFALTVLTGFHKIMGTWRNRIDKFIVVTDFSKHKLLNSSLRLAAEKVAVKPNSVDDLGFVGQQERDDYFLFVGRLSSEKGIHVLIDAAKISNVKIKILGDGPLKGMVEEACNEHENIEYFGFKDKSFIIQSMKACKALIFPSIWYEGLPLTILESYSTGTPVICSDIDNLNEIVSNKVTGLSFSNGNVKSLKDILEYFNSNPDEVAYLYQNCRMEFVKKYSQEVNYKNLMTIYSSLLD